MTFKPYHTWALYDYEPTRDDELYLATGESYLIISHLEGGWAKAKDSHGTIGVVPLNFMTREKQHIESVLNNDDSTIVNPLKWSSRDVCRWIDEIGLSEYMHLFEQNHMTGSDILSTDMNITVLKDMGIESLGKRMFLMRKITQLKTIDSKQSETFEKIKITYRNHADSSRRLSTSSDGVETLASSYASGRSFGSVVSAAWSKMDRFKPSDIDVVQEEEESEIEKDCEKEEHRNEDVAKSTPVTANQVVEEIETIFPLETPDEELLSKGLESVENTKKHTSLRTKLKALRAIRKSPMKAKQVEKPASHDIDGVYAKQSDGSFKFIPVTTPLPLSKH